MNSLASRVIRMGLRLQRPLLLRVRHPRQIEPVEWLMARVLPLPAATRVRAIRIGDVPGLEIRNLEAKARRGETLVYVHGGGFNTGSPDTHRAFAARLMQAGGFERVLMPRYRRAPAHAFPAASDDTFAFWRCLATAPGTGRLSLAGESAGANLALGACLRARDEGLPLPRRLYLHSPWLDLELAGASYHAPEMVDAFIGAGQRHWLEKVFARHYAGTADRRHPWLSPVHADCAGLPPLYVQTGGDEIFLADSQALAARCAAAGTPCTLEVWHGMWHGFALLAPAVPEANRALASAGAWLAAD